MTYRIHKSCLSSLILSCLSYNLQTASALVAPPDGNQGGSCPETSRRRVRLLLDTQSITSLQLKSNPPQPTKGFNAYFTQWNINNIKGLEFVLNSQSLNVRLKCRNRCLRKQIPLSLHALSPLTCFNNLYSTYSLITHLTSTSSLINTEDVLLDLLCSGWADSSCW